MPAFPHFPALMACVMLAVPALAQETPSYPALVHRPDDTSVVPIPPAEKGLQTIVAAPWLPISAKTPGLSEMDNAIILEGPAFDRNGNLLMTEVQGGRVMQVSPDRAVTIVVPKSRAGSAGIAIHKDGRLFIAGVGDMRRDGSIFSVRPDGSDKRLIVAPDKGFIPDDLVLDDKGGIYFTDFRGNNEDPIGGVYYIAPDLATITPVLTKLSMPNGLALSPDGKTLWVGETGRNRLHRVELASPTTIALFGTTIPYHFTGVHADSIRVDGEGNVYVALMGAGRVLVFDPKGVPIGQILVPGRDKGRFLYTSSVAIKPGTKELYIMAAEISGENAMIFRCEAFAEAPK